MIAAAAILFGAACGVRKAPRPPAKKGKQTVEVSAVQRGSAIVATVTLSALNEGGASKQRFIRADIYRLISKANDRPDDSEFSSRSNLIAALDIPDAVRKDGGRLTYEDRFDFQGRSVLVTYAVRLVKEDGQRLPFSSLFSIAPNLLIAPPPSLKPATVTQEHILLEWSAEPVLQTDPRGKGAIGFNVYRESPGAKKTLLNASPVSLNEYRDASFTFGTRYTYTVRSVTISADGSVIESDESKPLEIEPVDTFAPAPPTAITLAASRNTVSLFFAANLERDIKGYKIFRSESPDLPLSQWNLRTTEPLSKTTYVDETVEAGRTYYYFIVAVDAAGNESQPSEIVSETVPVI